MKPTCKKITSLIACEDDIVPAPTRKLFFDQYGARQSFRRVSLAGAGNKQKGGVFEIISYAGEEKKRTALLFVSNYVACKNG